MFLFVLYSLYCNNKFKVDIQLDKVIENKQSYSWFWIDVFP